MSEVGGQRALEREHHVVGVERVAVVEFDALAELELPDRLVVSRIFQEVASPGTRSPFWLRIASGS
jgi:hypothetical protein